MNRQIASCLKPIALTMGLLGLSLPSASFAALRVEQIHFDTVTLEFPPGAILSPSPGSDLHDEVNLSSVTTYQGALTTFLTLDTPGIPAAGRSATLPVAAAVDPSALFIDTSQGILSNFKFTDFAHPTSIRDSTGNFVFAPDGDHHFQVTLDNLQGDLIFPLFPLLGPLIFGQGQDHSAALNAILEFTYDGSSDLLKLLTLGTLGDIIAGDLKMQIVAIDDSSMAIDITETPIGWAGLEQVFYLLDTTGSPTNRGIVDGVLFIPGTVPEPSTLGLAALGLMGGLLSRRRKAS